MNNRKIQIAMRGSFINQMHVKAVFVTEPTNFYVQEHTDINSLCECFDYLSVNKSFRRHEVLEG